MHDSDSFIEEVSEAVRRDRLFGYFRKYGWIALVIVLLIVGGAAWREYSKVQERAAAQAQGDEILAALDAGSASARYEALSEIETGDSAQAVVEMLAAAEALGADDPAAAAEALRAIEDDAGLALVYRQMATLKRVMLMSSEMDPQERIDALSGLTAPGAPFRVLAEEQIALAEIAQGDREDALDRLRALSQDTEATGALRQRANRLILALGGEPDAA